jgi:hypothetical protein
MTRERDGSSHRCLRPASFRWALQLCCNDPDTGQDTGRVDAIQIGLGRGNFEFGTDFLDDYYLNLTGTPIRYRWIGETRCRLSRLTFDCRGYKYGVGNWCWDGCLIGRQTVRDVLRLVKSRRWTPEDGTERFWRWFEALTV